VRAASLTAAPRYQSAVELAAALRGTLPVLDALDVGGEEEEVAPSRSTSSGRGVTMSAAILVVALLAWWLLS